MNSTNISKINESLTLTSNSHANKNKIKPISKLNFISIGTYTRSFYPKTFLKNNLKYRKTDNFLNSSSKVDLLEQSHLSKKDKIPVNKNYLINLLKMKIKKNNENLPTIETFKTFSPTNYHNFKTISFDFGNKKTLNNFKTIFNNSTRDRNKEKINELYKKIYDTDNSKLKHIYVNQLMNKNKIFGEKYDTSNVNIRPKLADNINHNMINSEKRFLKYHGFNKRKKYRYNLNLFNIKKDKYPNVDSTQIMQLFLNKKLKIIKKDLKVVRTQFETAKNNLVSVYNSFNEQIQKDIDDVYGK